MRYIKTTNNYVEFIEADDSQNILSVRGFQFGELYFQIKNKKVTFYLNDQENPWRNDVWTINIPFELDGVLYEDEDSAAEALEAIINDSFQDQLDELKEDLADEVTRSTAKDAEHDALISALTEDLEDEIERSTAEDARLDQKIDDEIADRISGDTYLEGLINAETIRAEGAESAITATLNAEISRSTAEDERLEQKLDDEITRSTAKDASHDTLISGLTDNLNNEIHRALSAETVLHNEILDERDRALAAESALTDALANEVSRSTAKDAEHDALISGLTTSLQNEINRAVGAENSLRNDLNAEISARTSADTEELQRITALEVGKADKSDVYTKAESDAKYATKEYVSGNTYTKAEITTMMNEKADKATSISTALYNTQSKTIEFKNVNGNIIASVDARDFIKDGMVDTVSISGTNLVITFNTDAGKEDIIVPLTNIFDPSNYYTKAEVDASQLVQDNKINAISGDVATLSGDVITLSGNVSTISGDVTNIINSLSGDYATKEFVSAYTYDKATIDQKIADSGTFDPSNYYTKSDVDASQLAQDNKIDALSGSVTTISGNTYTKAESDAKYLTEHQPLKTINGNVISGQGNIEIASNNVVELTQAQYDALSPKDPTAFYIITDAQPIDMSNYYTKSETSGKTEIANALALKQDISGMSAYTLTSTTNALSGEVATNTANIATVSGATSSNTTALGGLKLVSLTQAQYDALTNKDSSTIYFIKE